MAMINTIDLALKLVSFLLNKVISYKLVKTFPFLYKKLSRLGESCRHNHSNHYHTEVSTQGSLQPITWKNQT